MPLYDAPRHRVSSYSVATTQDTSAGTALTYTVVQSAIPCSINTSSASTVERYAQQQISVSHTVGFLAANLTTTLTRGMKLVADDTGTSFHIEGIRNGRAAPNGTIPALVYADCSELI